MGGGVNLRSQHKLFGEASVEHQAVKAKITGHHPAFPRVQDQLSGDVCWGVDRSLHLGIGLHAMETIRLAPEKDIYFF